MGAISYYIESKITLFEVGLVYMYHNVFYFRRALASTANLFEVFDFEGMLRV